MDDDASVRRMLTSILEDDGYSVEAVDNGRQALKTCERLPFDVALVDINLPDVKGTALLHELKRMQPRMVKIIVTHKIARRQKTITRCNFLTRKSETEEKLCAD